MFTEVHTQYGDEYRVFIGTLVHVDNAPLFTFTVKDRVVVELPMSDKDMCALVNGAIIDFGATNGVEMAVCGLYIH